MPAEAGPPTAAGATDDDGSGSVLALLSGGELAIEGRIVDASNAAFLAAVTAEGRRAACIYKPVAGERGLWDFPDGTLAGREVAAHLLAEEIGWPLVPPTVWRDDGPAGPGMCQLWIDVDPDAALIDVVRRGRVPEGWVPVVDASGPRGEPVTLVHADDPRLRRLAALDAVINNADRKGGHVLVGTGGQCFGIDHGVTFHQDDKLRTVLWGWAGEPIPEDDLDALADVERRWRGIEWRGLITLRESRAARARLRHLLDGRTYPYPGDGWPALPWPAF